MRLILLCLLGASTLSAASAPSREEAELKYYRDLAETRNYSLGRPSGARFLPDGSKLLYLRGGPRDPVLRLYEFDPVDAKEREIIAPEQILKGAPEQISAEEKARRERARIRAQGFTRFELTKDGSHILVSLSGKLYVVDRTSLHVKQMSGSGWIDPRFSPDGAWLAAVRDGELHVIDTSTGETRAVTRGATETLSHGTAEFVAQEEMDRREGYWWSPDSQWLACQETDESAVESRYVADPLHPERSPTRFFYPRAGGTNAKVRLGIVGRQGGEMRWVKWDDAKYPYLTRVSWKQEAAPLTILVQDRAQQHQVLLAVDPATGATRELLAESDPAWLNLDRGGLPPLWLKDGGGFLWTTESRGAWQVELRDANGHLVREITPVDFPFRALIGRVGETDYVAVSGGNDIEGFHVWEFPLSGGKGRPLTAGRGVHGMTYSKDGNRRVHSYSLFDGSIGSDVVDAQGKILSPLPSFAEEPPYKPVVEVTTTPGSPSFAAAIVRPRDFQPGRKYPVILEVYAGPTSNVVSSSLRAYLADQRTADRGYLVIKIDGRGTPGRGRDWERAIRGNFIEVALNDQVAGLQALATRYPEIDLQRVGVTGWSFGGYFSAMAGMRRPDVFRAAVAGAPVATWENYDTFYTERYLGLPQENPEGYRLSNVTTYAADLKRPLLLIHGTTDDNVYFQHTLQISEAVFFAGKTCEVLPQSGTHMMADPKVQFRQRQRIMDFFDLHVRGSE